MAREELGKREQLSIEIETLAQRFDAILEMPSVTGEVIDESHLHPSLVLAQVSTLLESVRILITNDKTRDEIVENIIQLDDTMKVFGDDKIPPITTEKTRLAAEILRDCLTMIHEQLPKPEETLKRKAVEVLIGAKSKEIMAIVDLLPVQIQGINERITAYTAQATMQEMRRRLEEAKNLSEADQQWLISIEEDKKRQHSTLETLGKQRLQLQSYVTLIEDASRPFLIPGAQKINRETLQNIIGVEHHSFIASLYEKKNTVSFADQAIALLSDDAEREQDRTKLLTLIHEKIHSIETQQDNGHAILGQLKQEAAMVYELNHLKNNFITVELELAALLQNSHPVEHDKQEEIRASLDHLTTQLEALTPTLLQRPEAQVQFADLKNKRDTLEKQFVSLINYSLKDIYAKYFGSLKNNDAHEMNLQFQGEFGQYFEKRAHRYGLKDRIQRGRASEEYTDAGRRKIFVLTLRHALQTYAKAPDEASKENVMKLIEIGLSQPEYKPRFLGKQSSLQSLLKSLKADLETTGLNSVVQQEDHDERSTSSDSLGYFV